MARTRFHYRDMKDAPSLKPWRDPRTSKGRRLSAEEIAKLYPGVPVSRDILPGMSKPLSSEGGGSAEPKIPPQRLEAFEVVLLIKTSAGAHAAKPEEFRRVPVRATDPMSAQFSDEVKAAREEAPGYDFMMVAKPGQETHPEMMARQREMSGSARLDKRAGAWK